MITKEPCSLSRLNRREFISTTGAAVAASSPPGSGPTGESDVGLVWKREAGALALLHNGQVVWQFNFGANATKPFFHPVAPPGGPVLTLDRPPDHPWHRALWFSWKFINGVNYWEENPKTGVAQGQTAWREPRIETRPDFSARIVVDLNYRPANGQLVLTEHRVVEISPPDNDDTFHQNWTMTFTAADKDVVLDRTPLPGEPGGQPWGGLRGFVRSFRKGNERLTPRHHRRPGGFRRRHLSWHGDGNGLFGPLRRPQGRHRYP
jgi:hypothetical protein